jgi:RHS repeat-associated protein
LGRRYKFATGVTTTTYQYDGLNPVDTLFDGYFTTSNLYGTGLDDLFESNDNGLSDSFLRDALGSTVALTDSSGNVLDRTTYDPYGNTTDPNPGQASVFEFAGRENDGNSFYYMRGRSYDPSIARFISRDPAGLAGGINMYAYAGDSPTNFTDPLGLGFGDGVFPGVPGGAPEGGGPACGGCPAYGGGNGVVGAFEWGGVAFLSSQGGLGHDVPAFYVGQNRGGEGDPDQFIRFHPQPGVSPVPTPWNPANPDGFLQWTKYLPKSDPTSPTPGPAPSTPEPEPSPRIEIYKPPFGPRELLERLFRGINPTPAPRTQPQIHGQIDELLPQS